jgi:transcriptional regulator with XRE-family HTH domain
MTDTLKLKQILLEKGITIRELAVLAGIKVQTLSNKINNVTEFTQSELLAIQNALSLSNKQMHEIFLVEKVD